MDIWEAISSGFNGIAVSILKFFTERFLRKKTVVANTQLEPVVQSVPLHKLPKPKIDELDAEYIFEKIASTPPFQTADAKNAYIGLQVTWEVQYIGMHHQEGKNKYRISTRYKGELMPMVSFVLSVKKYPFFKIAPPGKWFIVTGKISEISELSFSVDLISLSEKD